MKSHHDPSLLCGIVLVGGHSRRMGRDKWRLSYHGRSQLEQARQLLSNCCSRVYISCRPDQEHHLHATESELIPDRYGSTGPMGALLSALEVTGQGCLLLACDLPGMDSGHLQRLCAGRGSGDAVAYRHPDGVLEPLCTLYEISCLTTLRESMGSKNFSLSKFLKSVDTQVIEPDNPEALKNINTPVEREGWSHAP